MAPPRRISNISDFGDVSHTGRQKRQRMDSSHKNAHFDKMIQSMSAAVNRDRRQRKASNDPSRSTTLASELSFINAHRSSSESASKVFPERAVPYYHY